MTDKAVEVFAEGRAVRPRVPHDGNGRNGFYFGGHGYATMADVELTVISRRSGSSPA